MKLKSFVSALSVVILAAGCAKTGLDPVTSAPTYKLLLTGDLDTKTSLAPEADGKRFVLWKTGDMLGLFVQEGEAAMTGAQNVLARLEAADENTGAGFSKGSFATSLALTASTTYTLGIYYPYVSDAGAADAIDHHIPAVQTQPAASDSRHLGLSGHFSYATASFTTPAELADDYTPSASFTMSHKTSAILLSVKAGSSELAGWKVKSVKVTAPEGCYLSGDVQYVPSTDALTLTGSQSESVALNVPGGAALSVDAAAELYLVAFPTSLAGKNLTITYTLEAADASSVKTLTHTRAIKAESKALGAGRVHMFEEALPASDAEGWVYSAADAAFDLSANGTANCYIVSAPGKYSFDATVIGNGQKGILLPTSTTFFHTESATIAPTQASLVWQQTKGLITSVALENGRVVFTKSASVDYGNALIAVKDAEGTILWSWHIWCTEIGGNHTYVSNYGTYEGMDRNLGATYASSSMVSDKALLTRCMGMYYQFGRKDPFIGFKTHTKNSTSPDWADVYDMEGNVVPRVIADNKEKPAEGSVAWAIKNPTAFVKYATTANGGSNISDWFTDKGVGTGPKKRGYYFWGNPEGYNYTLAAKPVPVKTIYDPCPVGYMVPPMDFYTATKKTSGTGYVGIVQSTGGGYKSFYVANYAISSQTAAATSVGYGYLWSSSYSNANSANVSHFRFANSAHTPLNTLQAAYGFGVRCVQELR